MAQMSKDSCRRSHLRGVLAADLKESDVIANNDEAEVRYNIFSKRFSIWRTGFAAMAAWLCRPW